MDRKQIVDDISSAQYGDKVIQITLKSVVESLQYEVYSNQGFYLAGKYHRVIQFGELGNHPNKILIVIPNVDDNYFIRFFNVNVVQVPQRHFAPHMRNFTQEPKLMVLEEPIFYFLNVEQTPEEKSDDSNVKVEIEGVSDEENK